MRNLRRTEMTSYHQETLINLETCINRQKIFVSVLSDS